MRRVINVDKGRICYSCEGFGYLARNCRNWGIVGQKRRMGYKDNLNNLNNLKEKESLVVLD